MRSPKRKLPYISQYTMLKVLLETHNCPNYILAINNKNVNFTRKIILSDEAISNTFPIVLFYFLTQRHGIPNKDIWFQQNGAPPHFAIATFPNRWNQ